MKRRAIAAGAGFALALLFGSPAPKAQTAAHTDTEQLLIQRDIQNLSLDYGHALDTMDPDELASVFAENGVWDQPSKPLHGRKDIREFWQAQVGRSYVTRHVVSNIRVRIKDRDHATGAAYLTMFRFDDKHPETIKSLEPALLGKFTDEYVRTPEGWKFAFRKLEVIRPAGPATAK